MNSRDSSVGEQAIAYQLYREHGNRLLRSLEWRMDPAVRSRIDPEDLVQNTILRALKKWPSGDLPDYPLFYRLGLDCLIDAHRHATRRSRDIKKSVPISDRSSEQFAHGLLASSTPDARAQRTEEFERIVACMEQMSESDRELLCMRHLDGLSPAEIADILAIDTVLVHSRYAKAMKRLRSQVRRADADGKGIDYE